jgi:hypothetical protein
MTDQKKGYGPARAGMTLEQMLDWLEAERDRLADDFPAAADIPEQIAKKLRKLNQVRLDTLGALVEAMDTNLLDTDTLIRNLCEEDQ